MDKLKKVIAIDFDNTLFKDNYPEVGAPIWKNIEKAKFEKRRGSILILWTCRYGDELTKAVKACKEVGLEFDSINENCKQTMDLWGVDARKVLADEYWDDKAVRV